MTGPLNSGCAKELKRLPLEISTVDVVESRSTCLLGDLALAWVHTADLGGDLLLSRFKKLPFWRPVVNVPYMYVYLLASYCSGMRKFDYNVFERAVCHLFRGVSSSSDNLNRVVFCSTVAQCWLRLCQLPTALFLFFSVLFCFSYSCLLFFFLCSRRTPR